MFALAPSAATVTASVAASKHPTWVTFHRRQCRPSLISNTGGYRSVAAAVTAPVGPPPPTSTSASPPPEAAPALAAPWQLPATHGGAEAATENIAATSNAVTASAALATAASVAPSGSGLPAAAFDGTAFVAPAGPEGLAAAASASRDGEHGSINNEVSSSTGSNDVGSRSSAGSGRDMEDGDRRGRNRSTAHNRGATSFANAAAAADDDSGSSGSSSSSSSGTVNGIRSGDWLPQANLGWGRGTRGGAEYASSGGRGSRGGRSYQQGRGWLLTSDTAAAQDDGDRGGGRGGRVSRARRGGSNGSGGGGGGKGSTMPPTSVAAANPQLFQELQAMRRQVEELTAMVSEQQRREVEQRQQLEALFQYVRSGSIPLPATTALPAATTSTDAAAAATVAATASAAHASPATVDSEPQRGQRVGRAAASALKETEGSHLAAAAAAATTTTQPPRPLQPPQPPRPLQPPQPLQASKDTAVESASVPVVAAAGVSGTADSAPTEVAPSNTVADGCLGEGSGSSSSSSSSSNNAFVVSPQMDDKQEEAQGLPVSLAVQPELLALLEQELNVRVGCSGNAALGGSSSSSTDEVKQTAGSDSTTSGRAADGQGRGTDTVVSPLLGNRTIISNAAVEEVSADVQHVDHGVNVTATMMPLLTLPVNGDDVIVTHGSADNVQEELRLLLALELQQAAAPSTAGEVDTSLQDVILGVGFRYDSTTAVPPPPTVTVLPPAASDKAISAVNEQGPQLPAAAGTAAHSPDATVGITTAPQPLSPASAPSVNTASGSGSSSTPMMSLAHDSITTYGDDGSSHSSSSRDSSSAGSSSEVFANESELRDVVGQLMSVASETARLARQAKQVGVALPPELQQPTVLPMALALLQRLRASKASAGSEALGGVPAAPDATAAEAVAVPPSVILPESSVATAPRHSGSGHADEQRRSRSEGRSSGGAVGGGGGAGGRRNLHFVTMRGGRGGGGRGGGGDRGSKEGNGGSKSDRTEPGGRSAVPVAAAAQPVSELTPDQLAALRAHPSYMFEGLRRLSWEGQEPLAAPAPSLSITPSSASAGLETPPAPLLRRPRRSARVETVGGRRRQAPQPGSQ